MPHIDSISFVVIKVLQPSTFQMSFLTILIGTVFGYAKISSAEDPVSFNRQIRPILSDICFNCHGNDEQQMQGRLRLDVRERALGVGDSGEIAIIPGNASASEMFRRITSDDEPMPPPDFEKQLSPNQIDLIKRWINEGAVYEGHWAFAKPTRPTVPTVANKNWIQNPVDAFVLKKLEDITLPPSKPASRETLLRRVTLDLTGLPPTIKEIDSFLADDSPQAYEKVVDRLLMSPSYGERMAIPWLDYARFADSNGFQSDGSRSIWPWRDWVINAYNRNLPFDQFTIDQLAGDMLENPTRDQIVATGFNRNHRLNGEGGRIVDEWFVETVIDRVETTGMTWMGLTFNCCRCHDHKYDPISQKEFFQMFAFFNSVEESGVLSPKGKNGENTPPLYQMTTPEMEAELANLQLEVEAAKKQAESVKAKLPQLVADWIKSLELDVDSAVSNDAPANGNTENKASDKPDIWQLASPKKVHAVGGVKFAKQDDGSYLAKGKNPNNATYEIEIPLDQNKFSGLMLEAFPHESFKNGFLGRSKINGNFVLTEIEMSISAPSLDEPLEIAFVGAAADFEQTNWPAQSVLLPAVTGDGAKTGKGWATLGFESINSAPNRILFVTEKLIDVPESATANLRLFHRSPYADHNIGRFRIQTSAAPVDQIELKEHKLPAAITNAAKIAVGQRTDEQKKSLEQFFLRNVPNSVEKSNQKLQSAQSRRDNYVDGLPTTMVMQEGKRRDAFILERGEYDRPKDTVERALPAFLPPMPADQPMDRLGLARWIVDPANPLTARVWVNRAWAQFFGTGIVATTENFGTQADFPSHPELLDWLAVEFMEAKNLPAVAGEPAHPWDMKAFHKMIVTSNTYRQSSNVQPQVRSQDPKNRLLARGPRFRLTGELIRDQALAVSGLLVEKIGGPSVRPYMPAGVWDETSKYGNLRNYKADPGEGRYRKTMYTIWKRTAAPPTMLLFDAPNREVCTVKRSKTNTPLQALSLLNENTFVEAAEALAARIINEGGDTPESKIEFGFRSVTGRQPSTQEVEILLAGFIADNKRISDNPKVVETFIKTSMQKLGDSLDLEQQRDYAAWTLTANILLNLDEFVTRE